MQFRILGPLRVRAGDTTVEIGSPKQRRLLAALLIRRGCVVSTDRLVAALWNGDPPRTALDSLRTYVYRLRATLDDHAGAEPIRTRPSGYLLDVGDDRVDAGRFERLLAEARQRAHDEPRAALGRLDGALDLWRGPALDEFADAAFARAEARRLEELRLVAAEERFEATLALGRHAEVVAALESFTEEHPLRERPRGQLMVALHRSGRRADALAVYRDLRELLDAKLGLEPSESLQALERDVLQQAAALEAPLPGRDGRERAQRESRPGDLPTETTSLVGRGDDVAAVRARLGQARLLTMTGPGGVGKTRLARRAAADVADELGDGVWWCELASIARGGSVPPAVADTLGVQQSEGRTVIESLIGFLRPREGLLVLDNCEHVRQDATRLIGAVIRACPEVTVLATSRVALGMPAEHRFPVSPLSLPDPDGGVDPVRAPAVRLLLERARAVRPEFDPSPGELELLAEVCRRLDGLPLAIELAAARLRSLNPADLAGRLDDRFALLVADGEADDRHAALRAVVDWSHGLLSTAEQRLFHRLSVFAGPFTLAAAEGVAAGVPVADHEVLDLLTGLVDHSLVTTGPAGGPVRYSLLETLRAYGRERLAEDGDAAATRAAHARYHVALAEEADTQIRSREEAEGVARLEGVVADLRAAHRWTVDRGEVDLALRLVAAVFRFALWRLRTGVLAWAETAVAVPGAVDHPLFPAACGAAAWAAGLRGEREAAGVLAERGLRAAGGGGDPAALLPLEARIHLAMWEGRLEACLRDTERAAALADDPYELMPLVVRSLASTYAERHEAALTAADDLRSGAEAIGNPTMLALAGYARGEALLDRDPGRAAAALRDALELAESVDNRMVLGVTGVSLTALHARHGEPQVALRSFGAVIDRLDEAGDWTHLWTGLRSLVQLLVRLERNEPAAVLLGAVRGADTAPPVYGEDADRLSEAAERLESRLGDRALATARDRGRAMADRGVVEFARSAVQAALADAG